MKWSLGSVNCKVDVDVSTDAKHNLFFASRMPGAVADDPQISFKQCPVHLKDPVEVYRSCFFFPLKKEFNINSGFDGRTRQRFISCNNGKHSSLIIRRAPCV